MLKVNKLSLNENKTKDLFTLFKKVKIMNVQIEFVEDFSLLDINTDKHLSLKHYIDTNSNKIKSTQDNLARSDGNLYSISTQKLILHDI